MYICKWSLQIIQSSPQLLNLQGKLIILIIIILFATMTMITSYIIIGKNMLQDAIHKTNSMAILFTSKTLGSMIIAVTGMVIHIWILAIIMTKKEWTVVCANYLVSDFTRQTEMGNCFQKSTLILVFIQASSIIVNSMMKCNHATTPPCVIQIFVLQMISYFNTACHLYLNWETIPCQNHPSKLL